MSKYYVSSSKVMCDGVFRGMAIAGPFDTREEASEYIVAGKAYPYTCLQLTLGPDNLGLEWGQNRKQWEQGVFFG